MYSESGHVQWCRLCADTRNSKHPFVTFLLIFDILGAGLSCVDVGSVGYGDSGGRGGGWVYPGNGVRGVGAD